MKVKFDKFTCRCLLFGKAPQKIILLGDKTKKPEPAQHIIEFPGGAIEVSRTSDGNYWAHIMVNRKFAHNDLDGMGHALGEIEQGRIDCSYGVSPIPDHEEITQIAILIRPTPAK